MNILQLATITLSSLLSNLPNQEQPSSQAVIKTHIYPEIAGQWELKLDNAIANQSCREIYNFGADDVMWSVSGEEWTYGKYVVSQQSNGLPIIAIQTIYDNNQVDCSGHQVDQTGDILAAYLKYSDTMMQWCSDAEGKQCFMDFQRMLP